MHQRCNNDYVSLEEFYLPFGGTLDPENRWLQLEELMPQDEPEETHSLQFSITMGAPATPARVAFCAICFKQKPGLNDAENVHQTRDHAYMQHFPRFAGHAAKAPFDSSMMVLLRNSFSGGDRRCINELVAQRGKGMLHSTS
jgi:IS5 family transposase